MGIGCLGGSFFDEKNRRKERKKYKIYYYVGCVHWQLS